MSQPQASHPGRPYSPVDLPYGHTRGPSTQGQLRELRVGAVTLDLDGYRVHVHGRPVPMPQKEFAFLRALMRHAGRVMTRAELHTIGWGEEQRPVGNKDLEVYIRRLRRRIEDDPHHPTRIRTVRGLGYIFDLPTGTDESPPP